MTRMPFAAALMGVSVLTTPVAATPFCADMLNAGTLESRYQRLAPLYNSVDTGWIFASDQLDNRYVLSGGEQAVLAQLVEELAARGTQLALMIAPPRPVVAGQSVLDETVGTAGAHDIAAEAAAFEQMIAQIEASGAIAPNLQNVALADADTADAFFFHRDTHWTNFGAALSALALADAFVPEQGAAFAPDDLAVLDMVEEPGSLSAIAQATCGAQPTVEAAPLYDYSPYLPQSGGLLGDVAADENPIVLLGTSFSDRNRRDQYQTTQALSAAIGRPVDNRSVSGGGMTGPFETYLLTGAFAEERPSLLIWEFPYTYQLNEGALRQLLGALRAGDTAVAAARIGVRDAEARIAATDLQGMPDLLGLRISDIDVRDVIVYAHLADGTRTRLRLRRKSRMDEVAIHDAWWVDLQGFDAAIEELSFELRGGDVDTLDLLIPGASG